MFDFDALTPAQKRAAGLVAINCDLDANPRMLPRLEELGVVESYEQHAGGHPPLIVTRYRMPIHVHMAWCEWASRTFEDEAEPAT